MDLNEKEDEKIVTFSESKPLVDTEVTPKELDKTVDEIDEYEIGKEGIVESYYDFGKPVIDVDRVEQKLSEYKQHREEIRK